MAQTQTQNLDWISFLNEDGRVQQAFVELVHVDAGFIKFKTRDGGNRLVLIPTCRVLKIKEKEVEE